MLALALTACATTAAATPERRAPLRPYYVAASAPACAADEGELGAELAALQFEDGAASGPLTPSRSLLVRAAHDCTLTTRVRVMRLTTNEAFAEACHPEGDERCEFVHACWAIGGPSERACDAHTAAGTLAELLALLAPDAPSARVSAVLGARDPAARTDAPTIYVETGNAFYGQGHLVQRIEGAWRVVVSALVWQS